MYLCIFRGDSGIVYLDGVTPPTKSVATPTNNNVQQQQPMTPSNPGLGGKLNHHQQLLQTIREQDEGESR